MTTDELLERIAEALEGYLGDADNEKYGLATLFVVQTDRIVDAINRLSAAVEKLSTHK
jgi:hypothetical protein